MRSSPVSHLGHLARRFLAASRPGAPAEDDRLWALSHLQGGERDLWDQMNNPDQRHAIVVARAVVDELGPKATTPVVAAALLHDVGKVVSGFRTPGRVGATVFWAIADDERALGWSALPKADSLRARLGQYRRHPEIGERLLVDAGAHPVTAYWAGDHHRSSEEWRVAPDIGQVLKDCDDD